MQLLLLCLHLVFTCIQHQYRICCYQISGTSLQDSRMEPCQWCMNNASAGTSHIPSLLQSGSRQATLSFFKWSNLLLNCQLITCLECWNASSKLWFHSKWESHLTRLQKRSMTGTNEYTQTSWLASPNYDLASLSVLGIGLRSSHFSWCYVEASKLHYVQAELEFYLLSTSIFCTRKQEIKGVMENPFYVGVIE